MNCMPRDDTIVESDKGLGGEEGPGEEGGNFVFGAEDAGGVEREDEELGGEALVEAEEEGEALGAAALEEADEAADAAREDGGGAREAHEEAHGGVVEEVVLEAVEEREVEARLQRAAPRGRDAVEHAEEPLERELLALRVEAVERADGEHRRARRHAALGDGHAQQPPLQLVQLRRAQRARRRRAQRQLHEPVHLARRKARARARVRPVAPLRRRQRRRQPVLRRVDPRRPQPLLPLVVVPLPVHTGSTATAIALLASEVVAVQIVLLLVVWREGEGARRRQGLRLPLLGARHAPRRPQPGPRTQRGLDQIQARSVVHLGKRAYVVVVDATAAGLELQAVKENESRKKGKKERRKVDEKDNFCENTPLVTINTMPSTEMSQNTQKTSL